MKKVYVAMSADIIHQGHLNVLNEARKFGDIIVGLHTDDVIRGYWRNPIMKYEERKEEIQRQPEPVSGSDGHGGHLYHRVLFRCSRCL